MSTNRYIDKLKARLAKEVDQRMQLQALLDDQVARNRALLAERDALAIRIYNSGYMAGHHDTVEGQFTDIHSSEMANYHADEVSELFAALQGEQP